MIIGLVKERPAWEYRVAIIPQTIKQLIDDGYEVYVETGAGERAGFIDEQYIEAGAIILHTAMEVYEKSEFIAKIWAPQEDEYAYLHPNLWILGNFESYKKPERTEIWQKYKINCVALERLPRLSRVQDMPTSNSSPREGRTDAPNNASMRIAFFVILKVFRPLPQGRGGGGLLKS